MNKVRRAVEPLAERSGTGFERLEAMATAHAFNLMAELSYHTVIHEGVRGAASRSMTARHHHALAKLNALRADYEMLFRSVIAEGIEDGSIIEDSTALLARTVLSSVNAIDLWFTPRPGQDEGELHRLATRIVTIIVNGVRSRPVST